jgi:hypothetical protein
VEKLLCLRFRYRKRVKSASSVGRVVRRLYPKAILFALSPPISINTTQAHRFTIPSLLVSTLVANSSAASTLMSVRSSFEKSRVSPLSEEWFRASAICSWFKEVEVAGCDQ